MKSKELKTYERRLQTLARRLRERVSDLRGEALQGPDGQGGPSPSDAPVRQADPELFEAEENLAVNLLGNEERLLKEVESALARLDRGVFGRCSECGKPIPHDRLHAVPYARSCVACAEKLEE
jgi:RNA polymerase-binding transcription factor DksA